MTKTEEILRIAYKKALVRIQENQSVLHETELKQFQYLFSSYEELSLQVLCDTAPWLGLIQRRIKLKQG